MGGGGNNQTSAGYREAMMAPDGHSPLYPYIWTALRALLLLHCGLPTSSQEIYSAQRHNAPNIHRGVAAVGNFVSLFALSEKTRLVIFTIDQCVFVLSIITALCTQALTSYFKSREIKMRFLVG